MAAAAATAAKEVTVRYDIGVPSLEGVSDFDLFRGRA
jgi:hypothetical protein